MCATISWFIQHVGVEHMTLCVQRGERVWVCSRCDIVFMLCLNCWLFRTVHMLLNSKHTPCPILCWQCHYSDTWHSKKSDVSDSEWATWEHGMRQPQYSCCRVGRWSVSECTQIGVRRRLWCTLSINGLWFAFPFWSADCSGQWGICAIV